MGSLGVTRLVSYKVESCERINNDDGNYKLELNTLLDTAEKEDETQELCI